MAIYEFYPLDLRETAPPDLRAFLEDRVRAGVGQWCEMKDYLERMRILEYLGLRFPQFQFPQLHAMRGESSRSEAQMEDVHVPMTVEGNKVTRFGP